MGAYDEAVSLKPSVLAALEEAGRQLTLAQVIQRLGLEQSGSASWRVRTALELLIEDDSVVMPVAGIRTGYVANQRPAQYLSARHSLARL